MTQPRGLIGGEPKVEVLPVGRSKTSIVIAGNYVGGISHQVAMRKFENKEYANTYAKRLRKVI